MVNTVSIIIRRPVGDERCALGLRTAYAAQSGGYSTSLVLLGDGVYSLIGAVNGYLGAMMTRFVEIEGRLLCLKEDLDLRGIEPRGLTVGGAEIVDNDDLAEIIRESDTVNVF